MGGARILSSDIRMAEISNDDWVDDCRARIIPGNAMRQRQPPATASACFCWTECEGCMP
uniref:Uncharacterized protein n=1 Tax=Ralstonia solanacearum TaxID=305 RepID=A0A0S4TXM2_RALSL|nr:conserved protein of unknown function [Ralstonia solanacearum]